MTSTLQPPVSNNRRPRFRRDTLKSNLVITERDLSLFKALVLDRLMSSRDLARLAAPDAPVCVGCRGTGVVHDAAQDRDVHHALCLGTGRIGHKKVIQRIGDLFESGHLDRPPAQHDTFRPGGSSRLIYALGNDGLRALVRAGHLSEDINIDWSARNDALSKKFVHHTLGISDFSVALQLAARRRDRVQLLQARTLAATLPPETAQADFPFKLRARIEMDSRGIDSAVIPDRAFALTVPSRHARRATDTLGFLAELDRGTMPVVRSTPMQTSIVRKLLTYELAHRAGEAERRLGWSTFRVPIVTTSNERIDSIVAAINANRILAASRLFLLTTLDAVRTADDVMTIPWRRPSGTTTMLLPEHVLGL